VSIPKFPTPEGQSLEAWFNVLKKYEDKLDENTIFVIYTYIRDFLAAPPAMEGNIFNIECIKTTFDSTQ
jgi:hypothetical protein